ncbi:dynein light chain Tctex-type 1 [Strigomonas culicis]|uniref:Dynein light chain Tctex-type 1 n=1 Tax=Strigomonas culicis TaxID=28005 RepID=S9UT97_9TRYP|nr:dynein light chain Tctex-type 1 [Strigomonas culicis]|eukprot:EPY34172.1 dynein light chain Tctex-type 1 [Strigomonas culicis]
MADYEHDEGLEDNGAFSSEAVHEDVLGVLRSKLGAEEWNAAKVDTWVDDLIGTILKQLAELKKPFKYIVNCTIMQRTGAAVATGFISLWDNAKDGMVHVPFETDTIHCLVTVYFLKVD